MVGKSFPLLPTDPFDSKYPIPYFSEYLWLMICTSSSIVFFFDKITFYFYINKFFSRSFLGCTSFSIDRSSLYSADNINDFSNTIFFYYNFYYFFGIYSGCYYLLSLIHYCTCYLLCFCWIKYSFEGYNSDFLLILVGILDYLKKGDDKIY